ncbi:MAG TPA: hypothetical protein EYO82_04295, partial [Gammaproteobacteria bacterium]|nr:hypothetical protein [Gammaproteobacteria bacterium]
MTRYLLICFLLLIVLCVQPASGEAKDSTAVDIADRRELFIDRYLVEALEGEARQILHHPVPREVVLVCDRPWEGNGLNYVTVFQDGDLYKMYYRGGDYDRGVTSLHE